LLVILIAKHQYLRADVDDRPGYGAVQLVSDADGRVPVVGGEVIGHGG